MGIASSRPHLDENALGVFTQLVINEINKLLKDTVFNGLYLIQCFDVQGIEMSININFHILTF